MFINDDNNNMESRPIACSIYGLKCQVGELFKVDVVFFFNSDPAFLKCYPTCDIRFFSE